MLYLDYALTLLVSLSCSKFKLTVFKVAIFSTAIAAAPEMTNCLEKRGHNGWLVIQYTLHFT